MHHSDGPTATLDAAEVDRFARLAAEWWDPDGKFRPLHQLGPARLTFIRDQITAHFRRPANAMRPLEGLSVLDIGCGGGLISEPMARMGAFVTGLDPATESIEAARAHARRMGLGIEYVAGRTESLVAEGRAFDVVLCLEVVEHVPDVPAFLATVVPLVRPGGLLVLSTLNRTIKAYALAIVGAEYILRWLPAGTHQWERFVTPDELSRHIRGAGCTPGALMGVVYDPLRGQWSLSTDTDVNYMLAATRLAGDEESS